MTTTTADRRVDISSLNGIKKRILNMCQQVKDRTGSGWKVGEIQKACVAMIRIHNSSKFQEFQLKNQDSKVHSKRLGRPSAQQMLELIPKLHLASLAYESNADTLQQALLAVGYSLMSHRFPKATGAVGTYFAFHPQEKVFLIGISGTKSLANALTDCMSVSIPHQCLPHHPFAADEAGDVSSSESRTTATAWELKAHEGILAAARRVLNEVSPILKHFVLPQGYKVHVLGHSLGAGTAALLAILLRSNFIELQDSSKLYAWCFAPPPMLDFYTSQSTKSFVLSVIHKSDGIPRASIGNVEGLARTLEKFATTQMREVLGDDTSWYTLLFGNAFKDKLQAMDDAKFEQLANTFQEALVHTDTTNPNNLYVPGTVIAMYNYSPHGNPSIAKTLAAYVDASHQYLQTIEMSSFILTDHFVHSYSTSLRAISGIVQDEEEPPRKRRKLV